jgi:alkyl hydroperoxide reductase subunit D
MIDNVIDSIPEIAKDVRVNFKNALDESRSKLKLNEMGVIAMSCAIVTKNKNLINALEEKFKPSLSENELNATKIVAGLMGVNNVYYRFTHLCENKAYGSMPAGLRMQGMITHGISKHIFELASIAVSAINGCGACMDSHERTLRGENVSEDVIQETVKLAAIINAVSYFA